MKNELKPSVYDIALIMEALHGCISGEWDRENCVFGEGAQVYTASQAENQAGSRALTVTMPDGSTYQITVERTR